MTMHVARGLAHLPRSGEPVFAVVGVFDGLHLGHEYLLDLLAREARARSARPMVITFDHHPDEVLTGSAPPLLCDPDERLARIAAAGVDTTVIVHFDERLRQTRFELFVGEIQARVPVAGFLMTPDAAFGYQRAGTPETLAALGRTAGFDVVVVPPFTLEGRQVRSTEVRSAIHLGDLVEAASLLGRPHSVTGQATERAKGSGSLVRFPLPVALPPDGTYRVEVGPVGVEADDTALVLDGALVLIDTPPTPWVRVAFVPHPLGDAPEGPA